MKKIILVGIAGLFSITAFAQSDSSMNRKTTQPMSPATQPMNPATQPTHPTTQAMNQPAVAPIPAIDMAKTNGVMMKDGKMMTVKGSKSAAMTADFTCTDGAKVTTSGTVLKKEGSFRLKEGQYIDKSGSLMSVNKTETVK